jgi:anti-sigma regulatory factor (Ser/Thr protein kinase)/CheY-like chemotaxis protein
MSLPALKSVLLVGADRSVRGALTDLEATHRLQVELVGDTQGCLDRLTAAAYDLVLTDPETTGADDVELLLRIHGIRPGTKVIVIASSSTPQTVLEAISRHAFSYFTNPFDSDALKDMIRLALALPAWEDAIEVKSAKPDWIALKVKCKKVTADRVVQFFRELKMDLPADQRDDIATAFREMLLNAMEHGASFDPDQQVVISCVRAVRVMVYRIEDPGEGFSFECLPHAAISNPDSPTDHVIYRIEHDIRPGGFGILIAKKLVDELIFSEKGNEVVLIKYLG